MKQSLPFHHPYRHDFVRVAVAVPRIRVADPAHNADQTISMLEQAAAEGASLVALPELGLAAYTSDDLFHQRALLDGCEAALARVAEATARIPVTAIVGLPVRVDHLLFNCAAVVSGGKLLGVQPKTYLPNYGEFYEARQFSGADNALAREVTLAGCTVPFGNDLIFTATNQPLLRLHVEICEDLWVPIPPSTLAALAGATVLVNLSASNITIGKADYRHQLVGQQSARCQAACLYTSSGVGESTTDMAWDGQALIYEAGDLLAESERFVNGAHFIVADVDLERVSRERMRQNTFGQSIGRFKAQLESFRRIAFALPVPAGEATALRRKVERFPYVPADPARRDERCAEVYSIQVQALVQRLSASGIDKVVLGISGGLDSTHALLVCARAMDLLGLPRTHILAWTMPGFATSKRTLDQARRLMTSVGCSAGEIDIRPSCKQMLADIGHPHAEGKAEYDITFENVQAGERTSHLFRLANLHRAIVVGTGDLSELALGWSTYGVGDHMSHYNVNASVPKTLVKHLVRWVAGNGSLSPEASRVLEEIAATEVSPELVPGDASEKPAQSSEEAVGPYELQDFHLYQVLRYGYAPSKVAFLAWTAWQETYSLADVKKHLRNFLQRFFKASQFKRSCVPNAPKVGSGGSLSPRGDWRAPSDSEATVWLDELETVPERMSVSRRGADRARRVICAAAIAGAVAALLGCAGLGPRTVELPQARLQELVARHFPVDRRLLDVIDLTLDSPRVGLQPEANRISVEVALRASGGGPIQTRLSGSLLVSEGLRFEPSDNTIRLVDVQVERFVIDGLPTSWQRQLDRLGKPLARSLLEDQVLYTLRPKDVAGLEGRGLRPGDLRVTASGVEITLLPVAR